MANVEKLESDYICFMSSLLGDKLQYESRVEVVSQFFKEAEKLVDNLTTSLQKEVVDFNQVDIEILQFKDCCSSIGTLRVKGLLNAFRVSSSLKNLDGCMECLQSVKDGYLVVKSKLEALLKSEQEILAAGGSIPIIS